MIANTEDIARRLGERLTWPQIQARYPRQWVVVAETEANEVQQFLSGRVVWHGPDRDEASGMPRVLGLNDASILFTGPMSTHIKFAL